MDRNEFDELMATKKESAPDLDGIPYSLHRCAGGLGSQFLFNAYKHVVEGGTIPALFAESRTVFLPNCSDVDNNGRIVRSPGALRLLTLCNCDCKILTTAICRGLALAHVACAPRESGILLTDFAAAYPSVNHSWIFHVLERKELPEFLCRFLRRIYYDSTTRVEFAGMARQFLMARRVRQGCQASGFLFAMAFDPIFRWLQDAIIPRNPASLDFPQPAQCACADDLALAALSFRCLMTALVPAFQAVDQIAWLYLNHRKCCLVQYGSESCQ